MTDPRAAGGQDPPADAALRAVLADAATFYRARLLEGGEPAVGLLRGRGLVDLAVDTPAGLRWRFGYAPDGGHHLLTHLRILGHPDPVIVAAGLAAVTGHRGLVDVLRDRLVVRLRDEAGVVGFAGRRLSEPLADAAWVPPKWLNTAYDGDPAGQAATVRAALILAGAPAVQVFLAPGQDPASILNGYGPRGLRRTLTATRPLVDAAVEARLSTWDRHLETANVGAAVDAARHVAPLIASAAPSEYARLTALVAAYTGLPADTVTHLVLDAVAPDTDG